jgi:hypothetical protein
MPNVQRVRRLLSTGESREHYYHRPTKVRLPHPDDPGFAAAYHAAELRHSQEQRARSGGESLGDRTPIAPIVEYEIAGDESSAMKTDVYLTPEELVARWRDRIDIDTLANWRSKRQGPPFHRFGGRAVLYRTDLVARWEAKNMVACDQLAVIDGDDANM